MHEKPSHNKKELDQEKFEQTKVKFMEELEKIPPREYNQTELALVMYKPTTTDMVYAILNLLSIYGVNKPFKKIETTMEEVIKEKNRQNDPSYTFADRIFFSDSHDYGEGISSWDMAWGFSGVYGSYKGITVTEEEKRNVTFTATRLWKKRLKPEMEYHLSRFKHPDNKQRLEDVFAVTRDVIQAL